MNDTNKRLSVIKMTGYALLLQVVFFLAAFLGVIRKDFMSIQHFWLIARYCLIIGVICYVIMICTGMILRRAFFVHLYFSASVPFWIIPLMLTGFELSARNTTLLYSIVFYA
jgi:hypothetical protein